MGTGVNMSSAEKVAALAARRAELEVLLAAKNEELYALCVQEVQLTGVVPPEAPLSPEPSVTVSAPAEPRERRASVRSAAATSDGDAESISVRAETSSGRRRPVDRHDHKNLAHRLSTPSISGASVRSAHSRSSRRIDSARSDFPSPDTFSIPSSYTYPSLAPRRDPAPPVVPAPHTYRHQTLTTDYMNKMYNSTAVPEHQGSARLRETHFSSSHPDIATHYTHAVHSSQPVPAPAPPEARATPLLYQYASQLKAQSQHLSGLAHHHVASKRRGEPGRRNTLQRTQTYHLTAHSDYAGHLERSVPSPQRHSPAEPHAIPERDYFPHVYVPMEKSPSMPSALHARERRAPPDEPGRAAPLSPSSAYSYSVAEGLAAYRYSPHPDRAKEKQWYETSLDSPAGAARAEPPLPRRNAGVKRSPSLGNSQTYEIMSVGAGPVSPRADVPLESPRNCTVVEQGKWIPYREVTKPFEMSDFYKYSTKFRQANQKAAANTLPAPGAAPAYAKCPTEPIHHYATQEHWHAQNH